MQRDKYPRVSEILTLVKDFSHIPKSVLDAKAHDGTLVHTAIHSHLIGGFPSFLSENYHSMHFNEQLIEDERAKRRYRYFLSYLKWEDEVKPEFISDYLETRFWDDELCYSGQIDGIMHLPAESLPVLIDFKTSAAEDPLTWPLQAHLYHNLVQKNTTLTLQGRFLFLRLNPTGGLPAAHIYKYDVNTWKYCDELVNRYHCLKKVDINAE